MTSDDISSACRIWGSGQLFAASACDVATDPGSDLVLRSTAAGLEAVHPGRASLELEGAVRDRRFGCDWLTAQSSAGRIRLGFHDARHLLVEGPVRISGVDGLQVTRRADGCQVLAAGAADGVQATVDEVIAARQRWAEARWARLPEALRADPLVPKLLQTMKGQVCAPIGRLCGRWTTPDRWPHRYCWLWDTAFHAVGWRHLDRALAREQLSTLLGCQEADGHLGHCQRPERGSVITQPPVLAWAVAQVARDAADDAWLADCYPRLAAFLRWFLRHRRAAVDGLLQWHTNRDRAHNPCDESGWDNSTRFDGAPLLDAVDLNAFFARECAVLARVARRLGRSDDVRYWQELHANWNAQLNARCWNSELGLYVDCETHSGRQRPLRTPAGLLPLVCGAPDAEQIAAMVRHLDDSAVFASPAPLPTVAMADQPGLPHRGDMWRGPAWINVNHQVIAGLQACGQAAAAQRLRAATVDLVRRWYRRLGSVYEFYDCHDAIAPPELPRKGCNDSRRPLHQVVHDYGWTATLTWDLLM